MSINSRINAIYPYLDEYRVVDIFGYSTKGLPGLEIIGLGKAGKTIKEKFIYLSKVGNIKLPPRRYVLCIEDHINQKVISLDNYRWFELPLLLLFWSLADQLPIRKLDDCFVSGKISVSGKIYPLVIDDMIVKKLQRRIYGINYKNGRDFKLITLKHFLSSDEMIKTLPLEELIIGKDNIFI